MTSKVLFNREDFSLLGECLGFFFMLRGVGDRGVPVCSPKTGFSDGDWLLSARRTFCSAVTRRVCVC